jgi:hypothetical protein
MRTTYLPTLALASLMLITACSTSTPKANPTTTTTVTTESPTTAPTTSPPTTAAAIAASITTEPPPTTTPPDVIVAIKQAVLDYQERRNVCLQDPTTCDPSTYARGAQLDTERTFVATAVGRRARSRRRVENPEYWVLNEVTIAPGSLAATVVGCHWSTNILEGIDGTIINDENASNHATLELEFADGTWWVSLFALNRQLADINDCGTNA